MESLLFELRDSYINNPTLFTVDFYAPDGGSRIKVECQRLTADPQDDAYIKSNSQATLDVDQRTFFDDRSVAIEHDLVLLSKYSPSGALKVIMKMTAEGALLELYRHGVLATRKTIPPTTHLTPIRSHVFGSDFVTFSKDETRFMYLADDPAPLISVYKLKELGVNRFKYRDSMGDRMSSHTNATIFVYDIASNEVVRVHKPLESEKSRLVYIQPQFADPAGQSIVCVAIDMVNVRDQSYFMNHPKQLQLFKDLTLEKAVAGPLGGKLWAVKNALHREGVAEEIAFFPKVSQDFSKVAYLFNTKTPAAALNYCGLRVWDAGTNETKTLITDEFEAEVDGFAGISGVHLNLHGYNWINDCTIGFNSSYRNTVHLYEVDLGSAAVRRINVAARYLQSEAVYYVATVRPNVFLCKRDCLYKNGLLSAFFRNADGSYAEVELANQVKKDDRFFEETITHDGAEAVFYGLASKVPLQKRPMILHIHGGPHSAWPNIYNPLIAFALKNHHTILNINYIGSIGRGVKFAKALLGKVGELEIDQIHGFVQHMITSEKCDPAAIKIMSGSFGGFVTLNLLQRYPDLIKSASIFNPISNIFSMWLGSNVIDWVQSEIFGDNENHQKLTARLSDEETLVLRNKSPIFQDFKFSTELLIFNGLKDDVVPPISTRFLFKKFRAHGLKTHLFEYPTEEHLILSISPNFDLCVKTALLFAGQYKF